MNRIDLDGRAAIVTGAASGIGAAAARRLAASGARVALWDRDGAGAEAVAAEIGGDAAAAAVDVADAGAVKAAVDEAAGRFGRLDILVNSAGVAGEVASVVDVDVDEWRRVVEVNLTGTFLCCRAAVPHMLAGGYGRIVNIASVAGKEGNPNAAHYSSSKAGVIAFTRSLGKELAGTGVIVNCVTPAVIETAMLGQVTEEHTKYMVSRIPLGRMGQPEEAAAMIAWMASEECSFSTAAAFDLSGGRATY